MPTHRSQVAALAEQPLALTELADHLLGGMPTSRCHQSRVPLPPSSGIGFSQPLDHNTGTRSEAVNQFTPDELEHVAAFIEGALLRPQRTPDEAALGDLMAAVSELNSEDLTLVTSFIDALVTKTRLKVLASGN